jgi:hypothetical protein
MTHKKDGYSDVVPEANQVQVCDTREQPENEEPK